VTVIVALAPGLRPVTVTKPVPEIVAVPAVVVTAHT